MDAVLTAQGVEVRFGPVTALRGVELAVREGEFVCLFGPSGCGKSTLLRLFAGLAEPTAGSVVRPQGRLAMAFQEPRLAPWLTALDNVALPLQHGLGWPAAKAREAARHWLARVGLAGFEQHHPNQLSGGMQQRVSLARAFAVEPALLLLDEPFGSLDELTARRLRQDLAELCANHGPTVLFVTHNPLEAAFLADRILVMTPRPGTVAATVAPNIPRPRNLDDPQLISVQAHILSLLEEAMAASQAAASRG